MNPQYLPGAPPAFINSPSLNGSHGGPLSANLPQKMQALHLEPPQQNGPPRPGQFPPGHLPPSQLPPTRQLPPGQMPPGHMPPGQMPPGQMPPGQMPPGQMPPGQLPPQFQSSQFPPGQLPPGQLPLGQFPPRQMTPGQGSPNQVPSGQLPPRQATPGQPLETGAPLSNGARPPSQPPAGTRPPPPSQGQFSPGTTEASPKQPPSALQPTHKSAEQPGFPSQQPGLPPQQPGFPPQQPGFPPQQQPGFHPQQPGFPPQQQGLPPQQPGFPPQQPSFPSQQPNVQPPKQPSFPPHQQSVPLPQKPGFPTQPSNFPSQQPGFPPTQAGLPPQQPGFPPQQPGFPPQQPGFPPQQPGFQPQQPGYPTQQTGFPPQQPGFPLPQPGFPTQQPGFPPPQPGFPPQQPGFPAQQPGTGYPSQQNQYAYGQQAPKRLNADQMPSPIQVMTEDQNNNGGVFVTNQKGLLPPLVATDFTVDDQGNASPRYIRSSMYNVPATPDMIKQTAVPFCVLVAPMSAVEPGEREPPLLDTAALTGNAGAGPVRCARCKAYLCPAMRFVGRHFHCAFCKTSTEVPLEYSQYLNQFQQYGQPVPEMTLGCYEFVATKEYCRNNVLPAPPALLFVIDVSYNAVRCGMPALLLQQLRSSLAGLAPETRVGIITYATTVQFYNINESLAAPQMLVVGDVAEVFVPLSHGLLASPARAAHLLDALAAQLPLLFRDTKDTETVLLPAVQAGLEALKAAECCGKLLVFHSSLPTAAAPGRLANRDDRKLLGTDKEKNVLNPQTKAYNEVAQECVAAGCGVELFLFNSSYVDAATLSQLPRLTGGSLYKYTYFQADIDGERFLWDLAHVLTRPTAYDAVMRVRTSTGVRATDFYGNFFMSNTTDVELATLDSDKSIGVEIKHDDKLTGEDGVYIQVALLYTHSSGQRRLRILNLALNVATQMADVYRCCDLDTIINFLTKQAVWRLSEHTPKAIKEGIVARCAQTLVCYRKHCASPTSAGQLVLPESMKLLPLYANCLIRSDALSGGADMSCDDRSWAMQAALSGAAGAVLAALYPALLCLEPLLRGEPPAPLRCSADKMRDDSIYLLENGVHMLMWIGLQTPPELLQALLGVNNAREVDTEAREPPQLSGAPSRALHDLLHGLRRLRRRCMRLTLVRQKDKLETVFRHFLVEDPGQDGSASYVDFLCHVHKEIRALL